MKKILYSAIILVAAVVVVQLVSCGQTSADDSQPVIAIIGAMYIEVNPIKSEMEVTNQFSEGNATYWEGTLYGEEVVLVQSRVGLDNANSCITYLVNNYDLKEVIFSGVAGACNPDLKIMDVVISSVVTFDYDPLTHQMNFSWEADPTLISLAETAGDSVSLLPCENNPNPQIVTGNDYTVENITEEFLYKDNMWNYCQVQCFEMEDSAIADVCTSNNVPFVCVRCISDYSTPESLKIDYPKYKDNAAKNAAMVVLEMIDELQPPEIITESLADGMVSILYENTLEAAGGVPPYTWSHSGNWPTGLTLNTSTGGISGIPATAGNYNFTVEVTDRVSTQSTTKGLSIRIASWTGTATFKLETLYKVNLYKDNLWLYEGSKLVAKFYKYDNTPQAESVRNSFVPPITILENENVPHPLGLVPVEIVRLVLTTDNTADEISTIASFTVTKSVLFARYGKIKTEYIKPGADKPALFKEYTDIKKQYIKAP